MYNLSSRIFQMEYFYCRFKRIILTVLINSGETKTINLMKWKTCWKDKMMFEIFRVDDWTRLNMNESNESNENERTAPVGL